MKRPFKTPPASHEDERFYEALSRDHDFLLGGAMLGLQETGNPRWAWYGVDLCIKAKKPFPDWLAAYLAQCADRILSDKAKRARDLRQILPWALGFAKKRGPGNPLDSNQNQHKIAFALQFAIQLDRGDDPSEARFNACNEIFQGKHANVDDRTLQRWLLDVFGLKKAPPNAPEWKNVIHEYFEPYLWALRDLKRRTKSRDILS